MIEDFVLTSESVTNGHPDKLCDQISDAIVGAYLHQESAARVVAECAVSTGIVFTAVNTSAGSSVDIPQVAREVIREVGYDLGEFNAKSCTVMTSLGDHSGAGVDGEPVNEERLGDDEIDRVTCGEQATLFGFACTHTPSLMPLPIWLAHTIARRLAAARREELVPGLTPDGKVQVAVEFRKRRPARIYSVTLIAPDHGDTARKQDELRRTLIERVVDPVFEDLEVVPDELSRIAVNPEGPVRGGPVAHAGLTGRKNGVDTYGEYSRHSGAALSGKDPSRIDRVGAYAARHAAKNVVAAGLAEECEVLLSYSIGRSKPVSVQVETFGTGVIPDERIRRAVLDLFDFRPAAIVRRFGLRSLAGAHADGFYRRLAVYGHMGREELDPPWERAELADTLRELRDCG
ncbi:MAG: methionine adenosyltransferase [Acidobacteriota bacterium]|jgi:S-adenosylmethionine synthetase